MTFMKGLYPTTKGDRIMIKVCPSCSNIDVDVLEKKYGTENVDVSCIGECGMNENQSFGYVFEKWVIQDNEESFLSEVQSRVQSEPVS